MPITPELLDELLKDYQSPDDMFGDDGLLQQLTKAVVERALQGELTHHLGYEKHSLAGNNSGNSRNGKSSKRIKSKRGQIEIDVPRDRDSLRGLVSTPCVTHLARGSERRVIPHTR